MSRICGQELADFMVAFNGVAKYFGLTREEIKACLASVARSPERAQICYLAIWRSLR